MMPDDTAADSQGCDELLQHMLMLWLKATQCKPSRNEGQTYHEDRSLNSGGSRAAFLPGLGGLLRAVTCLLT